MSESRPYIVTMTDGKRRIIEAANPAQVRAHVAKTAIKDLAPASARDILDIMSGGESVEIEKASNGN